MLTSPRSGFWLAFLALSHSACAARGSAPTDMALLPGGAFEMGTDSAEIDALMERYAIRHRDLFAAEAPRRRVVVKSFFIDRTPVTKGAFRRFLIANPQWTRDAVPPSTHNGDYLKDWTNIDHASGEGQHPVANVTWSAASAYCAWLGKRLPTEAEWEYAASGGLERPEFPWGDTPPDSSRANWSRSGLRAPSAVGRYPANGYGLYDMAGNVWEFLADRDPGDTTRHSIRGGSYGAGVVNLRVRYRDTHRDHMPGPHVGFRCARDA